MVVPHFIFWLSTKRSVTNSIARRGMKHGFARRFVAGETLAEALTSARTLPAGPQREPQSSRRKMSPPKGPAAKSAASYIEMIEEMHAKNLAGNISIKLTQLGLDRQQGIVRFSRRFIARRARNLGRTIEMDMESSAYTDATLDIFRGLCNASAAIPGWRSRLICIARKKDCSASLR